MNIFPMLVELLRGVITLLAANQSVDPAIINVLRTIAVGLEEGDDLLTDLEQAAIAVRALAEQDAEPTQEQLDDLRAKTAGHLRRIEAAVQRRRQRELML